MPAWHWQCHSGAAKELLRRMLPFLIAKRNKAEIALGLREANEADIYPRKYMKRKSEL